MKALLALEDGTVFYGDTFAGEGEISGEVVFNTSMTGYQEILTDPSYKSQIVTMTYPPIGDLRAPFFFDWNGEADTHKKPSKCL